MTLHPNTSALDPSSDGFLSPKGLRDYTTLSLATLWRMRRRGELPEPVRLSPGRVGWRRSVIDLWLATRAEAGR